MSPDAFRRGALLALSSAYVTALGGVWIFLDPIVAILAAAAGPVVALCLTIEETPNAEPEERPEPEGLSRRQIARIGGRDEDE